MKLLSIILCTFFSFFLQAKEEESIDGFTMASVYKPSMDTTNPEIADSLEIEFSEIMQGYWTEEYIGTNWSAKPENWKPDDAILISGGEIFFYVKGKLTRSMSFKFVHNLLYNPQPLSFGIELSDTRKKWSFQLIPAGGDIPYNPLSSKLHVMISLHPNCICGCPELLYSKWIQVPLPPMTDAAYSKIAMPPIK